MTLFTKITGLAIASVALAAPLAHASSTAPLTAAQTARLGAQTEAQGFKGIDRYLRQQHTEPMAHPGAPAWLLALEAHSVALDRQYGLGKYARAVDAKASAWHKTPANPVHAFS
jgi:uncharacterized membrane protein